MQPVIPANRIAVLVTVHWHREIVGAPRCQFDLGRSNLNGVDDPPWVLASTEQVRNYSNVLGLGLMKYRVN
jgi:hypothetical protein